MTTHRYNIYRQKSGDIPDVECTLNKFGCRRWDIGRKDGCRGGPERTLDVKGGYKKIPSREFSDHT